MSRRPLRQWLLRGFTWALVPATGALFLGNILVGALWLALADASGSLSTLRFATRVVNVADLAFTAPGAVLAVLNGAVLASAFGGLFSVTWLIRSLALFGVITLLWAFALVPLQLKLENGVAGLPEGAQSLPPPLRRTLVLYFVLGGLAGALAAAIGVLMVLK